MQQPSIHAADYARLATVPYLDGPYYQAAKK
jgi:hypothetical protein